MPEVVLPDFFFRGLASSGGHTKASFPPASASPLHADGTPAPAQFWSQHTIDGTRRSGHTLSPTEGDSPIAGNNLFTNNNNTNDITIDEEDGNNHNDDQFRSEADNNGAPLTMNALLHWCPYCDCCVQITAIFLGSRYRLRTTIAMRPVFSSTQQSLVSPTGDRFYGDSSDERTDEEPDDSSTEGEEDNKKDVKDKSSTEEEENFPLSAFPFWVGITSDCVALVQDITLGGTTSESGLLQGSTGG